MTSGKALQPSFLYATQLPQPSDRWGLSTPRPPHIGEVGGDALAAL